MFGKYCKNPEDIAKIEKIYSALKTSGVEVLWDDRDLGPGFKFKDSELIGFPVRLTVGKGFLEKNEITILNRKTMEETTHHFTTEENFVSEVKTLLGNLRKELAAKLP